MLPRNDKKLRGSTAALTTRYTFLGRIRLLYIFWAMLKGTLIATVTVFILGTTFIQSLVIALVSGGLGLIGMVLAAYVAATEARHNRALLQDIKRNTGTDNREGDREDVRKTNEGF